MSGTTTERVNPVGLGIFVAAAAMLFTAFAASYLIRRTSSDWRPVPLPTETWVALAVLAASSLTLEASRSRGVGTALLLGVCFFALQGIACSRLAAQGVYLSSNPHASFYYLLTGVHGVHALGGLIGLAAALARPSWRGPAAFYWHFMGGAWLFLLILLTAV
jgi:cytochrome c oxidase subunit 3